MIMGILLTKQVSQSLTSFYDVASVLALAMQTLQTQGDAIGSLVVGEKNGKRLRRLETHPRRSMAEL